MAAVPYLVVFVVALGARVGSVLARGGYGGYFNYDSGVYYAAADALIHGRLPYRDFTLVHPPGQMLALSPFAALGGATSDHTGFVVACVAFSVLGALAAVVVMLVVRQLVASRLARWAGGLAYACYLGAVNAEIEPRLEPLANLLLLVGLLGMLKAPRAGRWVAVIGGAALAASVSVKIWYVVPAAVVVLGYLAAGRRHRLAAALAGIAVGALAVNGPFFVAAPRAMFHAVVSDQLGRPANRDSIALRLTEVSGYRSFASTTLADYPTDRSAAVVAALVLVVIVVLSAIPRASRLVAVVLVAQVAVLLASPTFFHFYVDYLTPPAAVCAGVSAGVVAAAVRSHLPERGRRPVRAVAAVGLVAAAALGLSTAMGANGRASAPYPAANFAPAAAGARCIVSENPQTLIQLNALSRGLAAGCPNWVDVQGRRLDARYHLGAERTNATWRRAFGGYLLSGDAVAFIEPPAEFTGQRLRAVLQRAPLVARSGRICLIQTTDEQRRQFDQATPLAPLQDSPVATCTNLGG